MALLLSRCAFGARPLGNLLLSRGGHKLTKTSFTTTVPRLSSDVRTPIQVWGYDYLVRQAKLKRPIAPHLGIYQAQLTWYVSGLHRITGTVMGCAAALLTIGITFGPLDFPHLIEWIRGLGLPAVVVYAVKWCISFPIVFHMLNGVRFLGFDMAKGLDLRSVYRGGWGVVGASLVLATLLPLYRSIDV